MDSQIGVWKDRIPVFAQRKRHGASTSASTHRHRHPSIHTRPHIPSPIHPHISLFTQVSLIQKWDKHLKEVASAFPDAVQGDEKIPESVR